MRTLLSGEFDTTQGVWPEYFPKLETQNADGTWIDVGGLFGSHWIINAQWGETRDTPVGEATFTLLRAVGNHSLSPLVEGSDANVDDASAYAPLLEIGRLIRFNVATQDRGTTLDTGKYREVFTGRIDDVNFGSGDDGLAPIVIKCSDLGGWLMDTQVEDAGKEYGTEAGVPLEDVLQAIIDDWPDGGPAVTLVKESASDFAVAVPPGWQIDRGQVLETERSLLLECTGEDIRYRYDDSHVSQLMWFNPDRGRSTVDQTFAPDRYLLQRLDLELANVRNAGRMAFVDAATGAPGAVTSEDSVSIGKYRRRFFELPGSTALTDESQAQAVIDAAVNDLSGAPAEVSAFFPDRFLWFVQLYDRYTFTANAKDFDTDQTFSVNGYQHTLVNGRGTTTLTCSGRVIGAYSDWLTRIRRTIPKRFIPDPTGTGLPPAGTPHGCVLAIRARTLLGTLTDGDGVAVAPDTSGNYNHALVDGTGTDVIYRENVIPAALEGLGWPVFEFARGKTLITGLTLNPGLGATLYMVARRKNHLSGADYFLEFTNSAGDPNDTTAINDTGESGTPSLQNDLRWTASTGGYLGAPVSDWFLLRAFLDAAEINALFNGAPSPTLTPGLEIDDVVRRVRLGRHLAGYIADIFLFDSELGTDADQAMLKMLSDDYGFGLQNATPLIIRHGPTGLPEPPYDGTVSYPAGSLVTNGGLAWFKLSDAGAGTTPVEGDDWMVLGGTGFRSTYSNDTANTDPGSGSVKFDSTTLSAITSMRVSETNEDGDSIAAWLASLYGTAQGYVVVKNDADPTAFAVLSVSGAITDNGGWDTLPVSVLASNGSFTNDAILRLSFYHTTTGAVVAGSDGDVQYNDSGVLAGKPIYDFGYWSPLTNGDPSSPELIFDGLTGDTISVFTPT